MARFTSREAWRTAALRQIGEVRPMHVLAISDQRGWAFDRNMQDMARYVEPLGVSVGHYYLEDHKAGAALPDWALYDVVFNVHHRSPLAAHVPKAKTVGSLRSRWFTPEYRHPPGPETWALVNSYRAFQVVTADNYLELVAHCPSVVYLTNPVDVRVFTGPPEVAGLAAEWNGNSGHDSSGAADVKGLRSIIEPACQMAGVPLAVADAVRSRLPAEAMPSFYRGANVALCASEYEGASNSVMEAMACGLAVVATDVGNHRELVNYQLARYGTTGIVLVDRNVYAMSEALKRLRSNLDRVRVMGQINRQSIVDGWSWEVWAPRYVDFLRRALG